MRGFLKAIFATFVLLVAVSCTPRSKYVVVEGYMLGTTFRVVANTAVAQSDIYAAAMEIDSVAKSSMSIFNPNSLISRINDNGECELDVHLLRNIAVAARVNKLSGGAYDITIKPLTDAYGFAAKGKIEHPNIDSLLAFVGFEKFRVNGRQVVKEDSRLQFDLNSLAKGYTVDMFAEYMQQIACHDYIIEIGGEIRASGVNAHGKPWRIGVDSPFEGNQSPGEYQQTVINISDKAVATSGNYRRYYTDSEGNKITHTISPKTGKSVTSRLLSATVVAPLCVEADAMATMFMAMGDSAAIALAEELKSEGVQVYFVLADGEDYKIFSTLEN